MTAFSDTGELTANQSLTREVQIAENGQYALEVVGQDPQSKRPTAYVLTPIIASIQPHEIKPAVAPAVVADVAGPAVAFRVPRDAPPGRRRSEPSCRPWRSSSSFRARARSGWTGRLRPRIRDRRRPGSCRRRDPGCCRPPEGLRDGVAHFRLSSQGLEVLRWECPNIRVIPPVLEGLVAQS